MPDVLSFGDQGYGDEILAGLWLTIQLAVASLALGLALGLLAASGKLSDSRLLRGAAETYATVIRGLPEFLVVLVVYFGLSRGIQSLVAVFGHEGYLEINAFVAGVIALGLVFGAFAGEVFRGAFLAVPHGQIEAGIACGFSRWQVFWRIRVPQMWRFALPGLGNLWLVLLKDTSLISVIALNELLRWSKVGAERTNEPFTFYLAAAVLYLAMTVVSNVVLYYAERRASRGVRRA